MKYKDLWILKSKQDLVKLQDYSKANFSYAPEHLLGKPEQRPQKGSRVNCSPLSGGTWLEWLWAHKPHMSVRTPACPCHRFSSRPTLHDVFFPACTLHTPLCTHEMPFRSSLQSTAFTIPTGCGPPGCSPRECEVEPSLCQLPFIGPLQINWVYPTVT